MAIDLIVDADLEFSVDIPGSRTVSGTLTGSGKALELRVSDPFLFAGRKDAGAIKSLAAALSDRGLTLRVVGPPGPLVTLGRTKSSWLQRRLTGSRHMRVERGAGLWSLARGRAQAPSGGALPASELAPPPTLFPVLPTMARPGSRGVTTTHNHGGNPRLVLAPSRYPRAGERQPEFRLRSGLTTIGSGEDCDIVLPGLAPLHAEVRQDEADEFVIGRVGAADVRVNGALVQSAILRTGTGVDLGSWHLSYFREEYADHGRPYGGRIGGELGHQRTQPPRPNRPLPGERDS